MEKLNRVAGKSMIKDLTEGSVFKKLIVFALPMFLTSLLQVVYGMVDMVIVGQFEGSLGLSAVSIGSDVMTFLTFMTMGVSLAAQITVAQFVGAGKKKELNDLIGTTFTFLMGGSAILATACLILCNQILGWVNAPPEAMDQARAYVMTCACGLIFTSGYHLISSILRGMGDSTRPMVFIGVASGLNVLLDLLFVGAFGMKAMGAALATVISQTVSFLLALLYLYRRKERFGFDFKLKSFRMRKDAFLTLLKLGIPMMIQMGAINFSVIFNSSWINTYGTTYISITGIGAKLDHMVFLFAQAFGTAGSSMIGQCIGAEKYARVPRVIGISSIITCSFCGILALTTALFPDMVFGMFVSERDVILAAHEYIPVAVLQFLSSGVRQPLFGLINGSGNSKLNLMVAIIDGVVGRIGFCLLLGVALGFGIQGFWYGTALAGCIPIVIGLVYLISGKWKTRKHLIRD